MFNSGLKKEWLAKLEETQQEYSDEMNSAQEKILQLFEARKNAVNEIKNIESFVNTIANTPKDYKVKLEQVSLNISYFDQVIHLKDESDIANKITGGVAGAGVLAGTGVAALGPTAAMAIATTFGTASTGTAISALSGAAATNAALAWLGGGALAAGGGGVSAGGALLALAGPIGWAIGGAALIGGALFAAAKNKKIAVEAENNVYKLKDEIANIIKTRAEVTAAHNLTSEHTASLTNQLIKVSKEVRNSKRKISFLTKIKNFFRKLQRKELIVLDNNIKYYNEFNSKLKSELGTLINNTLSLSMLVEKKIG